MTDEKMRLIIDKISLIELKKIAEERFGDMVKAVVDLELKIMVIGAEMHSDAEGYLLERGSKQDNLWGINLYPDNYAEDFVEFDSMINIKPRQNNRSRGVDDKNIQIQIREVINKLINYDRSNT